MENIWLQKPSYQWAKTQGENMVAQFPKRVSIAWRLFWTNARFRLRVAGWQVGEMTDFCSDICPSKSCVRRLNYAGCQTANSDSFRPPFSDTTTSSELHTGIRSHARLPTDSFACPFVIFSKIARIILTFCCSWMVSFWWKNWDPQYYHETLGSIRITTKVYEGDELKLSGCESKILRRQYVHQLPRVYCTYCSAGMREFAIENCADSFLRLNACSRPSAVHGWWSFDEIGIRNIITKH